MPKLILELDSTIDTTTASAIAQAVKRLCIDEPPSCRAVLVTSDDAPGFAFPKDPARQHIVWIPDFTHSEANDYLDKRGFMNATTEEKDERARTLAKIGTRPAYLRKLVQEVALTTSMTADQFVESEMRSARESLHDLLGGSYPWTWLVRALLESDNGFVHTDDIPRRFSVLLRVADAGALAQMKHTTSRVVPTRSTLRSTESQQPSGHVS